MKHREISKCVILINQSKGEGIWYLELVSETTVEMYEEMTPQLIKLIDETKHNDNLTEAQKQDEISLHFLGYTKACTNEIIIEVLGEILGLE